MSLFAMQDEAEGAKVSGVEGVQDAARAHRPLTVPGQSPSTRPPASTGLEEGEAAATNKELRDWLRQHPTYTMDMAGFTPVWPLTLFTFSSLFPFLCFFLHVHLYSFNSVGF